MDKSIIENLHSQWRATKAKAEIECESRQLGNLAQAYRECQMFKGSEDFNAICDLYKSTRGLEFCIRYHFPSLSALRLFKSEDTVSKGIYIDAGKVEIHDPTQKILLIGNTQATVYCSETRRYEIAVLHGAEADIHASGWSFVSVQQEQGTSVLNFKSDNAIII